MASLKKLRHESYTIAWICALPLEMAAAKAMLDNTHAALSQHRRDGNTYTLGEIGGHNVVIACLPSGIYGLTSAGIVASQLLFTFTAIRFGVMVGIGGGAPSRTADIRLGDVVVSKPTGTLGGVVQFDLGKTLSNGRFERTGALNKPPQVILTALSSLQADDMMGTSQVPAILSNMVRKYPAMEKRFAHPGQHQDWVFEATYEHTGAGSSCDSCDRDRLINRDKRLKDDPVVHYGLIASSNQVMRDGVARDRLAQELGVLCFEMEAAGLMDSFPCVVIRGICDYSDSHKSKQWQEYAAATAAAYAKCLISASSIVQTATTQTVLQVTSGSGQSLDPRVFPSRSEQAVTPDVAKQGMQGGLGAQNLGPNLLRVDSKSPATAQSNMAAVRTLDEYFSPARSSYKHEDFDAIAMLLSASPQTKIFSRMPRLYTLIRHLEQSKSPTNADVVAKCAKNLRYFLDSGLSDQFLPFSQTQLPAAFREGWKSRFIAAQPIVCDNVDLVQMMVMGKHITFDGTSPDKYFTRRKLIATGERGEVDEILSVLNEVETYARKRFYKRFMRGANVQTVASFENEVKNMKCIVHHHCVKLVASYSDPKYFALIMSPVAQCNLAKYLTAATGPSQDSENKRGFLPRFFGCLVRTLWFLHRQKLRHRDIKPENILVFEGNVLFTDFDCSYSWAHTTRSTTDKVPPRTWKYAAPEVALSGFQKDIQINSSSDIWSLGCVFLEIITVWMGKSLDELNGYLDQDNYYLNIDKLQKWMESLRREASPPNEAALEWVARMLQRDADMRPSAHELVELVSGAPNPWQFYCSDCQEEDHQPAEGQTVVQATNGSSDLTLASDSIKSSDLTGSSDFTGLTGSSDFTELSEPGVQPAYVNGSGTLSTPTSPMDKGLASVESIDALSDKIPSSSPTTSPITPTRTFSSDQWATDVCAELGVKNPKREHWQAIEASYKVFRKAMLEAGFVEIEE
ncbi:hypothetical protein TWF730_002387 [Orbilia blumenaviensis]|uniref:Protein kinase domain-containing protein n=1 Tax=Orbilia blumenaviensis TaxID=1796055 RepID=A0AAV9UD86_9PEZI